MAKNNAQVFIIMKDSNMYREAAMAYRNFAAARGESK